MSLLNRVKWIAFLYSVVSCGSLFSDSAYKTERIIYFYMWKDIEGYEGLYQVSDCNEWVKSLNYNHTKGEKMLKSWILKWWYWVVWLRKNTIRNCFLVSRLVAIHFIPNPNNLPLVCHKDETLDENWFLYNGMDNLFWWTHKDNMQDMANKWRSSLHLIGNTFSKWKFWKDHHWSKKVNQYTLWLEFIKEWDSIADVQRNLSINHAHISAVCLWKRKSAWWFIWKYKPI
jgi:hypothetical protein